MYVATLLLTVDWLSACVAGKAGKVPTARAAVVNLRVFIQVASVVIMRLLKREGKQALRELPSMFIVMDKVGDVGAFFC